MISVVAAVVEANDAFLLTRRQKGVHLAGMWEFPGGKIDAGESHEQALRREMREELDVDVLVEGLMFETVHAYEHASIALFFYRCRLQGTPRPLLGQEMRWVPRDELPALGFPPADEQLITLLTSSAAR